MGNRLKIDKEFQKLVPLSPDEYKLLHSTVEQYGAYSWAIDAQAKEKLPAMLNNLKNASNQLLGAIRR
ncbi:MAG: hypothetical protein ACOYEB_12630 [Enterococcus lemanii]|jgi:hypothetical protein